MAEKVVSDDNAHTLITYTPSALKTKFHLQMTLELSTNLAFFHMLSSCQTYMAVDLLALFLIFLIINSIQFII